MSQKCSESTRIPVDLVFFLKELELILFFKLLMELYLVKVIELNLVDTLGISF